MVKGFFEQLGCQESRVYDVGTTEWGSQGNPVVYAKCDEGAPRTLVIYWMYDTMPVTQPDVVDGAAVRRTPGRAGAVQESPHRPRRHELERAADGPAERVHGDQGGHGKAAGESDLRGRRRRRADVDRFPAVRQDASRALQGRRGDVSLRRAERERRRRARRAARKAASTSSSRRAARSGAAARPSRTSTAATSEASTARPGATCRCSRRWCPKTATRF